ncbi:MAG: 50S ribosome-binding GTPase, partial [Proteobacteria bacterium]|nr:50S ribosome-binding GTPase [Pseudomonadota bacterium]
MSCRGCSKVDSTRRCRHYIPKSGNRPIMGFKCGIVGLPNVGKSTLFNSLTRAGIAAENYPFCTIDPNIGVVEVRDGRPQGLDRVGRGHHAQRERCVGAEDVVLDMVQLGEDLVGRVEVAQDREGILLVDQHAAHERVLFEKYLADAENDAVEVQTLMFPQTLELSPDENAWLLSELAEFRRLGFR